MSRLAERVDRRQGPELANKKATEFAFKSLADSPIGEWSVGRRAVLFAECSMISYLSIEQCNIAAGQLGFTDGKFFNCGASQAYWFTNEHDSVVVCRGTEPNNWDDLQVDANAVTAVAETVGKVHRGFKQEADEVWPHIETVLEDNKLPVWFCGHSLGGALATICAARCKLSYIRSEPEQVFTYGSPRIGCHRYVNHVELDHYRWVNNNDIVTRVPPAWMGYRHCGKEMYLDRNGLLKNIRGWRRMSDRLQGFFKGLRHWKIDQLADHSAVRYKDYIFENYRNEVPAIAK